MGSSGSGKSTMLNIIGALCEPDSGSLPLVLNGVSNKDANKYIEEVIERVGLTDKLDSNVTLI